MISTGSPESDETDAVFGNVGGDPYRYSVGDGHDGCGDIVPKVAAGGGDLHDLAGCGGFDGHALVHGARLEAEQLQSSQRLIAGGQRLFDGGLGLSHGCLGGENVLLGDGAIGEKIARAGEIGLGFG